MMVEALEITEPVPPAAEAVKEALLEEIRLNPDDPEPYLVYADILQREEAPRGELIVLTDHHRREKNPRRKNSLLVRRDDLLSDHPHLLGDLGPYVDRHVSQGPMPAFDAGPHYIGDLTRGPISVRWFQGFIESVRIHRFSPPTLHVLVREIARIGSARFLRGLSLGPARAPFGFAGALMHLLATQRVPLRSLFLGDLMAARPTSELHTLEPLIARMQHLRHLGLRGRSLYLRGLALPALSELRIFTTATFPERLSRLSTARLPALRLLEVDFGGSSGTARALEGLMMLGPPLPSLGEIRVRDMDPAVASEVAAKLSSSHYRHARLHNRCTRPRSDPNSATPVV